MHRTLEDARSANAAKFGRQQPYRKLAAYGQVYQAHPCACAAVGCGVSDLQPRFERLLK